MAGVEREGLAMLDAEKPHSFLIPTKKINDGEDLDFFLSSIAYTDLMKFLLQLNHAMIPRRSPKGPVVHTIQSTRETWDETVQKLGQLISDLTSLIDEAPPDPGPRRFGNISFRKWHAFVEERLPALLNTYLPSEVTNFQNGGGSPSAVDEIQAYLLGSFGSAQRLDFGTGHELSFLAFIACIWKLGGFKVKQDGEQERGIVLGIIDPYLTLIKKLVLTYTLEPAGSHGVWGLDDHFFLPYIFGSAQLSQAINPSDPTPIEGSVLDAPLPRDVTNKRVVEEQRTQHMYFEAIGFIYDVKRGPFWEHSPVLHDISGITAGWGKINKGMLKMFNAEVLSKFPVVQHFPFGSLFKWVRDPLAAPVNVSTHAANQPKAAPRTTLPPMSTTVFPSVTSSMPSTNLRRPDNLPPVALPPPGPNGMPTTRAPWASNTGRPTPPTQPPSTRMPPPTSMRRPPPP